MLDEQKIYLIRDEIIVNYQDNNLFTAIKKPVIELSRDAKKAANELLELLDRIGEIYKSISKNTHF